MRHALQRKALKLLVRLAIRLNDRGSAVLTFGATWDALTASRLFRTLLALQPDSKRSQDLYSRTYILIAKHLKDFDCAANVIIPESLKVLMARREPLVAIHVHDEFARFSFLSRA